MSDALKARDAKDVEDAVRWALAEGKTLEVAGRGSKRGLGRPSQTDLTLDLSGLSGVTLYEPEELVLSAKAGTPLAEIEHLVESKHQQLAFEPMDYGPILGGRFGAGTLGGALAANLSGPRRIKAGAARDHFLGVSAVSGRAETFKSTTHNFNQGVFKLPFVACDTFGRGDGWLEFRVGIDDTELWQSLRGNQESGRF